MASDGDMRGWLTRSARLAGALAWRTRHEGLGYLAVAFAPYGAVLALLAILPSVTGGKGINGATTATAIGLRYGAGSDSLAAGLLLLVTPGLVAVFGAITVSRLASGLIGTEVARGGMELLLSAPYTPGAIAAALLGYLTGAAVAFWAVLSAMSALALTGVVLTGNASLTLPSAYLTEALLLPLLATLAGVGLTLMGGLLFPKLTQAQLGPGINLAGGSLGNLLTTLPALALLLAMAFDGQSAVGSVAFCAIATAATAVIAVISVLVVACGFRPEAVMES